MSKSKKLKTEKSEKQLLSEIALQLVLLNGTVRKLNENIEALGQEVRDYFYDKKMPKKSFA